MKVLEFLAYGRGILLAIVLIATLIYWFLKKKKIISITYKNISKHLPNFKIL